MIASSFKKLLPGKSDDVNWMRATNYLASQAVRRHFPLIKTELVSLAGLAIAKAKAYYNPTKATCSLRQWAYSQGWRLLLAEVRNELRRRRRSVPEITFTDLEATSRRRGQLSCLQFLFISHRHNNLLLSELLEGLSFMDRNIILLRIHQWTYQQISHHCGLSRETVRQRLMKVRPLLERRLQKNV